MFSQSQLILVTAAYSYWKVLQPMVVSSENIATINDTIISEISDTLFGLEVFFMLL